MVPRNDLPRLITRSDIARFFSVDRRRQYLKNLRPIAFVEIGGKRIDLYESTLLPSVAVNDGDHPIEQATPKL